MSDLMTFPYSVEEFMERYKIVDTDGIYMSKGAELVPIFRMRQWFEHLPSAQTNLQPTCNQLATDCISRQAAIDAVRHSPIIEVQPAYMLIDKADVLKNLVMIPSAQPDKGYIEQIKWERDLAIRQLADLGYGLGEKPRTNDNLIDRQAAIKAIENLQDCYNGFSDTYDKACIIGALEEVPSAQPEIVRCRECRHAFINEYHEDKPLICGLTKMCGTTDPDWFCADGERRNENDRI